jgi:hypothetical protein
VGPRDEAVADDVQEVLGPAGVGLVAEDRRVALAHRRRQIARALGERVAQSGDAVADADDDHRRDVA